MMRIPMTGYRWIALTLLLLGAGILTVGTLTFPRDLGKI